MAGVKIPINDGTVKDPMQFHGWDSSLRSGAEKARQTELESQWQGNNPTSAYLPPTQGTLQAVSRADPADQSDTFPAPTTYLFGSKIPAELIKLPPAHFLSPEDYEEARSCPAQCNLRLRTALATPSELASFSAVLPATDACRLSPVIRTQLQRWEKSGEEGRYELKLQIGVSQEILDRAVRGIYERTLLIDSSSLESFLLLADYLQMDWLSEAVKDYAREHLPSRPSLKVCKLAAAYPFLGLFMRAVRRLIATEPETEAVVHLMILSDAEERTALLTTAAHLLSPDKCLDYLLSLSSHSEVGLTREEAALLLDLQPSLKRLPSQGWFAGFDEVEMIGNLQAWSLLYMRERDLHLATLKHSIGSKFLVWDIPLPQAKEDKTVHCPTYVTATDGRRFSLMTTREDDKVGLWVRSVGGRGARKGDRFRIFPVGSIDSGRIVSFTEDSKSSSKGVKDLVSRFEAMGCNTVRAGEYLPVVMLMLEMAA